MNNNYNFKYLELQNPSKKIERSIYPPRVYYIERFTTNFKITELDFGIEKSKVYQIFIIFIAILVALNFVQKIKLLHH